MTDAQPPDIDILIVDDTPTNLAILEEILTYHKYGVRPALNGEMAINAVKNKIPDLVLLDIMMPGMDGYEVCRRLKADPAATHVPVLFISALDRTEDIVNAFESGGVDYISKPFQEEEVLARIRTHLTLRSVQKRLEDRNMELQRAYKEIEEKNEQLQKVIDEVKTLRGFVPICASCKKIRDDKGYWKQVEEYIEKHTDAKFSHGICPSCYKELYPEIYERKQKRLQAGT